MGGNKASRQLTALVLLGRAGPGWSWASAVSPVTEHREELPQKQAKDEQGWTAKCHGDEMSAENGVRGTQII